VEQIVMNNNAKKNAQQNLVKPSKKPVVLGNTKKHDPHGGGQLSREDWERMKKNRAEMEAAKQKVHHISKQIHKGQNKSAVVATQHGRNLTFSRPITHITGFGKYNMSNGMVKPQKVFTSPEHEKDYHKKKAYKEKAKHQGSDDWWSMLKTGASKAFEIAAPHIIQAMSGFGDYHVHTNSMLAAGTHGEEGSEIPMMCNTKTANIMRHREFICNVLGTTDDYRAFTFPIQPGMDETFPWLHLTAQGFTSYKMLGAVMEFNSLYGQITAGGYLGYVAMGTQYNSMEPIFPDKETLVTSEYANSKRTDQSFMHPLECSPEQQVLKQQYIRSGDLPDNSDLKFYDLGNFTIATGGQATDNGIVGELWITYEVAFFQPKLARTGANYINADHWTAFATATSAKPFGDPPVQSTGSTMVGSAFNGTTRVYSFPPLTNRGIYKITYISQNPAVAAGNIPPTISAFVNCGHYSLIDLDVASTFQTFPGAAVLVQKTSLVAYVQVSGAGATIEFSSATLGAGTYMDFFVSEIPGQITRKDLIQGTDEYDRRFKQGYQDKTKTSELLENRILNLQNKLNLVKSREDKKKDIEKEDYEYGPRVIKNCIELYPEISKNEIVQVVMDNDWDYAKSLKQLSRHICKNDDQPIVTQANVNILQKLIDENPEIGNDIIFEVFDWAHKDIMTATATLFKIRNVVRNGGNAKDYWAMFLFCEKQRQEGKTNTPMMQAFASYEASASESETEYSNQELTGCGTVLPNQGVCFECKQSPKYAQFQRCLNCKIKKDNEKFAIRIGGIKPEDIK
jgi:hypothetical protein